MDTTDIPDGRTLAPRTSTPPSEFFMTLNGFDEIAIAARFGEKITDLRADPFALGRALAFVHLRRQGATDTDAWTAAQNLTLTEVTEYFAPEPTPDAVSAEGNAPGE